MGGPSGPGTRWGRGLWRTVEGVEDGGGYDAASAPSGRVRRAARGARGIGGEAAAPQARHHARRDRVGDQARSVAARDRGRSGPRPVRSLAAGARSEEHTSELQSPCNLVCRLLLEKKKTRGYSSQPVTKSTRHAHAHSSRIGCDTITVAGDRDDSL